MALTTITSGMLPADIISDHTNIGAAPAETDELLISDAGVLKAITIDKLLDPAGYTNIGATPADSDELLLSDAGVLKAVTVANLMAAAGGGGLTEADSWRNTSNFDPGQGSTYVLTANLSRSTQAGFGKLGTGMAESSGVFTFPSTGYWAVLASFAFSLQTVADGGDGLGSRYEQGTIEVSLDAGSSWTQSAMQVMGKNPSATYTSPDYHLTTYALFDVTSTANVKVRFSIHDLDDDGIWVSGTSTRTSFHFLKLGDT